MSLPFAIRKGLQVLVLCIILFACFNYFEGFLLSGDTFHFSLLNTLPLTGILIFGTAILFRYTHPLITGVFAAFFGSFLFTEQVELNAPIISSVILCLIFLQWHRTERTHYHQFRIYRWLLWASTCLCCHY